MSIVQGQKQITLSITDDGRGMPRDRVPGDGMGLYTMRERALVIGGDFELESAPGQGTTVRVTLPLTGKGGAE